MNDIDAELDSGLGFSNLDFGGVDFDQNEVDASFEEAERFALELELDTVANQWKEDTSSDLKGRQVPQMTASLAEIWSQLAEGKYVNILRGDFASELFGRSADDSDLSFRNMVRKRLAQNCNSKVDCVQAEMVGIAAFNLFQQLNYTGPSLNIQDLMPDVNPHQCFREKLRAVNQDEASSKVITERRHTQFHNSVLAELACDGQWPCQVVEGPYFLLLARCIFLTLADSTRTDWMGVHSGDHFPMDESFVNLVSHLSAASIWTARASVAHERLLLDQEPTTTLWKEIETIFPKCIRLMEGRTRYLRAMVFLEFGLACHHFSRSKQAKAMFLKAKEVSGLFLEVSGADGKRTKFQHKATAQLVVRAASLKEEGEHIIAPLLSGNDNDKQDQVKSQMVGFNEDTILHEHVQFENEAENKVLPLTILDQAILLGLCLDIKDNNPADKLTAEEMSAYLARVLCHHDDWMVYSTALLERAWLEFEGNHTKERSILQMQALADQHTDRLTITQSTRKSIDDSSPVQDRLKNLHSIVYPPRWQMLGDVAERYASIGIVTSAAEIFAEIESWDEVVDCYRRAGRAKRAEDIVRERLTINETPRMWTALGDITNEPEHYEKAIELSLGRFSQAYVSLGKYFFDTGDLQKSVHNYRQGLKLRPLIPSVWFRVGTICMQLKDWEGALVAFTEVVLQRPEEAEAWANIAAIHIHNKKPADAYPALSESTKYGRSNWRVWVSKLYTCLDLRKFDEATQACNVLLDLKSQKSSQQIPDLEEKCVRAIVGGTVDIYMTAKEKSDNIALDAARRSLVRVQELLDRLGATMTDPWVYETRAFLYGRVGLDKEVFENLMKEYRSLTSLRSWEKDDQQVRRVCSTVTQIVNYQRENKEEVTKSRFLLSGVVKKIKQSRSHGGSLPEEVIGLEQLLHELNAKLEELS
jgi:tetratricopeptide (TPR) repeat protein